MKILLIAVNARYSHSSYAARTLKANLLGLEKECGIIEADLRITPIQLAEQIVELNPKIALFSIYLWNLRIIEAAARILQITAPHIKRIAGGPELTENYKNADLFDQCIIGEGERALHKTCWSLIKDPDKELPRIITAKPVNTEKLKSVAHLYSDDDIANRVIYIESSRGCLWQCAYCTSAGTALRTLTFQQVFAQFDALWKRGARRFKFLDRSFNISVRNSYYILFGLLTRATPEMRIHLEINPERLAKKIISLLIQFPKDTLHLECGVQTLNPKVAQRIGRSSDIKTTLKNLKFLTTETKAIVHADLIFGLPGEDEASFADGFNKLIQNCHPPEVQVNRLKGLPGTSMGEHPEYYGLKFNPEPPYELLSSDCMDFNTLNRIQRFARCWELIHNRGRFKKEVDMLHRHFNSDLYTAYMNLAEQIYGAEERMHNIAASRLQTHLIYFMDHPESN